MTNKNSIEYLAYLLDKAKTNLKDKAIIFLGAGTSVSAGIPLTNVIVRHIRLKFYKNPLIKNYRLNGKSDYYDLMALLTADERRDLFHFYVTRERVKLNVANVYLAQLLKEGYVDYILTVNFDDLILRACTLFNFLPPVYDISNIKTITTTDIRTSSVTYLHGQYFGQWLLNNNEELNKVENEVLSFFNSIKTRRTWIVVGYSGNDGIFNKIKSLGSFSNELFWVKKQLNSENDEHVLEFLKTPNINAHSIEGYYADSFFLKLHAELSILNKKLSPPDVFYKPFTYLKSVMNNVSEINDNDELNKNVKSIIDNCNSRINKAINAYENKQTIEEFNQIVIDAILKKQFDEKTANEFFSVINDNNFDEGKISLSWYFDDWGSSLTELAILNKDENLFKKAIEKYNISIELNPKNDNAYSNFGLSLQELAKLNKDENLFNQSIEILTSAIKLNSRNEFAFYNLGISFFELAKIKEDENLFNKSIENYKKAIDLNPKSESVYNNLGNAFSELGDLKSDENLFKESIKYYKIAIQLNPKDDKAYNNWGLTLELLGSLKLDEKLFKESIEKYKEAIKINAIDYSRFYNLGIVLYKLALLNLDEEIFKECFEKYEKAIKLNPNYDSVYYNWGVAIFELAKLKSDENLYVESIDKFERAIKINPNDIQFYVGLSLNLYEFAILKSDKSLYIKAFQIFEKIIKLNPFEETIYQNWSALLLNYFYIVSESEKKKILDEAFEKAEKAYLIDKNNVYNLACCYALTNDNNNALKFLEIALKNKRISVSHVEKDIDWNRFKEDKIFKNLLNKYKNL